MSEHIWTDAQFDTMSWHDNYVHAIRIIETGDGEGDLILDVDHIVEWIKTQDAFSFRVLPVTLTFHGVMFLRLTLDYAAPTAAFTPFMIREIERRSEQREGYVAQLWKISISWPVGELTFEGRGFTQRGFGEPILSAGQCLSHEVRNRVA